jgi:hypothetical protein
MVASPVGYRCPECARGPRPAIYSPSTSGLVKAAGVGIVVSAALGFFWGSYPSWGFYMALLLGFGVAESIAKVASYKRGPELQALSMGCVFFGIVVSRYTIAQLTPGLSLDLLLENPGDPFVRSVFYLRFIPDMLFMALSFVICYIRFK